jgi:hypothetical protein
MKFDPGKSSNSMKQPSGKVIQPGGSLTVADMVKPGFKLEPFKKFGSFLSIQDDKSKAQEPTESSTQAKDTAAEDGVQKMLLGGATID